MSTPHREKDTIAVPKLWYAIHYNQNYDTIQEIFEEVRVKQQKKIDRSEDKIRIVDKTAGKKMTTALHEAVIHKNSVIIDDLGLGKANFNVDDINGSTPLHYAALYGFPEIFTKLLEWGAFADIRDNKGRRALDRCDRVNKLKEYHACEQAVSKSRKERQAIITEVYSTLDVEDENIRRALSESISQPKKTKSPPDHKKPRKEDENMRRAMEESMSQHRFDEDTRDAMANSISQIEMDEKNKKKKLMK
jgi:ankyrin repeat protein